MPIYSKFRVTDSWSSTSSDTRLNSTTEYRAKWFGIMLDGSVTQEKMQEAPTCSRTSEFKCWLYRQESQRFVNRAHKNSWSNEMVATPLDLFHMNKRRITSEMSHRVSQSELISLYGNETEYEFRFQLPKFSSRPIARPTSRYLVTFMDGKWRTNNNDK